MQQSSPPTQPHRVEQTTPEKPFGGPRLACWIDGSLEEHESIYIDENLTPWHCETLLRYLESCKNLTLCPERSSFNDRCSTLPMNVFQKTDATISN